MALGGAIAQRSTWIAGVERVISGGTAPDGVSNETRTLSEEDTRSVQDWLDQLRASRTST